MHIMYIDAVPKVGEGGVKHFTASTKTFQL